MSYNALYKGRKLATFKTSQRKFYLSLKRLVGIHQIERGRFVLVERKKTWKTEARMIVWLFNTMLAKFRLDCAGNVTSSHMRKHIEWKLRGIGNIQSLQMSKWMPEIQQVASAQIKCQSSIYNSALMIQSSGFMPNHRFLSVLGVNALSQPQTVNCPHSQLALSILVHTPLHHLLEYQLLEDRILSVLLSVPRTVLGAG